MLKENIVEFTERYIMGTDLKGGTCELELIRSQLLYVYESDFIAKYNLLNENSWMQNKIFLLYNTLIGKNLFLHSVTWKVCHGIRLRI